MEYVRQRRIDGLLKRAKRQIHDEEVLETNPGWKSILHIGKSFTRRELMFTLSTKAKAHQMIETLYADGHRKIVLFLHDSQNYLVGIVKRQKKS